tara:strand:+ start:216 stop:416 length:201 start_codon:yes stop_codon:yes gene_type:complete
MKYKRTEQYMIFSHDDCGIGIGPRFWGIVPQNKVKQYIKEISKEQEIPQQYFTTTKVVQPSRRILT